MAFFIKVTNLLNQRLITNYRMPKVDGSGEIKGNPFLSVEIQPRAMFNELIFASEAHYKEWRRQNDSLYKKGIIVEGELLNEKKILGENERLVKEQQSTNKDKIERNIDKLQESADHINASLEFNAIDEASAKPRNRRKRMS